jgi:hypothetical protein
MDFDVRYKYNNTEGSLVLSGVPDYFISRKTHVEMWLGAQLRIIVATLFAYAFGASVFNTLLDMNKSYIESANKVIQLASEPAATSVN